MKTPGEQLIDFIIKSELFHITVTEHACIVVWSANAAEQLDSWLKDNYDKIH